MSCLVISYSWFESRWKRFNEKGLTFVDLFSILKEKGNIIMFKKIIDKIEQATINYTIKHSKPFTYYLNRPDGKCCKTRHTSFNTQSRYFYDDKGRENVC